MNAAEVSVAVRSNWPETKALVGSITIVVSSLSDLPKEFYEAIISSCFLTAAVVLMAFSVLGAMTAIIADQERLKSRKGR